MTSREEVGTGVVAAVGGAGAAMGTATAVALDTDPLVGLVLACATGAVLSGGAILLYTRVA